MLKSYLTIALRNLWKNKTTSFINIFGLAIGLSSCLLIGIYIQHELSYDNFQLKADRIARVIMEYSFNGGGESIRGNFTSTKVAPVFKRNFPEVASAVRMAKYERSVSYKDKLFSEPNFMFADSTFFDFFTFKLIQGDPHKALEGPNKVVITESTAKKFCA